MTLRVFLFSLMLSFAVPQVSSANVCAELYGISKPQVLKPQVQGLTFESQIKVRILEAALSKTKIKLTEDQAYIDDIVQRWDIRNSTPYRMEQMAQALVMKVDYKKTFLQKFGGYFKNLIFKGEHVKEALRIRSETLVLTQELTNGLKLYGYEKQNSKYERYKAFREKHFNKIQAGKFVLWNSLFMGTIYHFTNGSVMFPIYFPFFNLARSLDIKPIDLELVQNKGFLQAFPIIYQNYKLQLGAQRALEQAPGIFFLSIATYISYNYLNFKAEHNIQETRNEVAATQKIPISEVYFAEWKADYEKREGRKIDSNDPQLQHDWDLFTQSLYLSFTDIYRAKHNEREPDLTKEQDLLEWEQFLSSPE